MFIKKFFTLLVMFLIFSAVPAWAVNGVNLIGAGPVSRSMGGVGIAAPQDAASAIYSNPATMSFTPFATKTKFEIGATILNPHADTTSVSNTGIGNLKDSPVPNFIINAVAKRKQKKTGAIMLLDNDFTIGNIWNLQHKVATTILIDKDRIVRYICIGKTPNENIPKLINLIKDNAAK